MDREADFEAIKNLLLEYAADDSAKETAGVIAKKAFLERHLYEDMGFLDRKIFNEYMAKLYPELSLKKPKDIRWKKFLFDSIGSVAPSCEFCGDIDLCFSCDIMK